VSAMTSKLSSGVFRGRPFGGVAFLWGKSILSNFQIVYCDSNGRCLCAVMSCKNGDTIKLINVYFPCFEYGPEYRSDLDCCLGFIESAVTA
jgi:hypothetical protein